jgi:hypothetical protein
VGNAARNGPWLQRRVACFFDPSKKMAAIAKNDGCRLKGKLYFLT